MIVLDGNLLLELMDQCHPVGRREGSVGKQSEVVTNKKSDLPIEFAKQATESASLSLGILKMTGKYNIDHKAKEITKSSAVRILSDGRECDHV